MLNSADPTSWENLVNKQFSILKFQPCITLNSTGLKKLNIECYVLEDKLIITLTDVLFEGQQEIKIERSQNTVLLVSSQAVYKAPHSTVREQKQKQSRRRAGE